jgi:pyruvate dehydrogenase E2 component (dihydrolipoamide acetyltransferase)
MADQLGINLTTLRGTGPNGAITKEDVERAASGGAAAVADRSAAMRQAIAAAVTRSKREIPHYYLASQIDLSRALAWLREQNANRPPATRILPAALMLKAVAQALHDTPELNGFWLEDSFRPGPAIHVGVAIFLRGGGLVAPALLDADRKEVSTVMAELQDLVARARTGGLRGTELTSPTITLTNLGDRGVESVFGVIHPPQVAIVGIGRITERPWAEAGILGIRPVVDVTLAADHRASDGHSGSRYLTTVNKLLQTPEAL